MAWYEQLKTQHAVVSLIDWANTLPTLSSVELAQRLPVSVPPSTLREALVQEAHEKRVFPEFARTWLVRLLHEQAELSSWASLFDADKKDAAKQIWQRVAAHQQAHPNWAPTSGDDRQLVQIFSNFELSRSRRVERVEAAFARIDVLKHESLDQWLTKVRETLPVGFVYLAAMRALDTAIRAGGFAQLYQSAPDSLVTSAIEGFVASKSQAAEIIRKSIGTPSSWLQLDISYLKQNPDVFELAAKLLDDRADLFDQSSSELHHTDGRIWRVRVAGTKLELEIVVEDEEPILRTRTFDSAPAALAEAKRMVDEQLHEGFSHTVRA